MDLLDYLDTINEKMVITYHHNQNRRFSARFDQCEVKEHSGARGLLSEYGNGHTPREAIDNYLNNIRGKVLVFRAAHDDRKEYVFPDQVIYSGNY